ncbi:MAG: type I-E CRISPR-associated protein Cas5/CasD [Peptococcaceae bacterium]|nr:type I-E CRISPR-associated protein Cas5/CasD [Peptococcaceae bacterium]
MSTLLLRLAAPLQSWGVASKFDTRDTAREPTKSGVIGLLAAALGRSRTEGLEDLNDLRFGVRIDQPGTSLRDFHTARLNEQDPPFVTTRYYLADAVFLVGLEGEDDFLQELIEALENPVFPLYLGRRSCPPAGRLVLGLRERDLPQALEEEPWQACEWFQKKNVEQIRLTIVYDAQPNEQGAFLRRDLPVSFDQRHRRYGFRMVRDIAEAIATRAPQHLRELPTGHDAMAGWGD